MERKINLTHNPHLAKERTEFQRELVKKVRADLGSSYSFGIVSCDKLCFCVPGFVAMRGPHKMKMVFSGYVPLNLFSVK